MDIWASLLKQSAASAPDTAANMFLLAPPALQNDVMAVLNRGGTRAQLANGPGPGFGYIEYMDPESEDKLAQLNVHVLADNDHVLAPALTPMIVESGLATVTLVVLAWSEVDQWAAQLQHRLHMVEQLFDNEAGQRRAEDLKFRIQTYGSSGGDSGGAVLPLEAGQYACPLGCDVIVYVTGAPDPHTPDGRLDFCLQFVRTVAYVHGASLVFGASNLLSLVAERLNLSLSVPRPVPDTSTLDKTVIPAGWDTRAKILALREEFPLDSTIQQWWNDCDAIVALYKTRVPPHGSPDVVVAPAIVTGPSYQEFLAQLHTEQESEPIRPPEATSGVNGIQVDSVEDVLRRLKLAASNAPADPSTPTRPDNSQTNTPTSASNDVLANFFQNLLDRNRSSPAKD